MSEEQVEIEPEVAEDTDITPALEELEEVASEAAGEPQEAEEAEAEGEQPQPEPEKRPEPRRTAQERISDLTRKFRESEREAERLRKRLEKVESQQVGKAPKPEEFDDEDDYLKAERAHQMREEVARIERERIAEEIAETQRNAHLSAVEAYQARANDFAARVPDFNSKMQGANVPIAPALEAAIMRSEIGPMIAYHLASNQEEAVRLSQLPPHEAMIAFGKLEARLEAQGGPAKPKVKTTSAPPPPRPVKGTATASVDMSKLSIEEWMAERNKQVHGK